MSWWLSSPRHPPLGPAPSHLDTMKRLAFIVCIAGLLVGGCTGTKTRRESAAPPAPSPSKPLTSPPVPAEPKTNIPPPMALPMPAFNIDFGPWKEDPSPQSGPAAAGCANDYWNTVAVAFNNSHIVKGLKFANRQPCPIQAELLNLGGAWNNGQRMAVHSPMLNAYSYAQDDHGSNSQVILHQVPEGVYDVYVYGHGTDPLYYGDYALTVGNHYYGRKSTSHEVDAVTNTTWVEGSQYVRFRNVKVGADENVEILIRPGGSVTEASGQTYADPMICGLQLLPAKAPAPLTTLGRR